MFLIGEIENNIFKSGFIKKPSNNALARLITKQELELILGYNENQNTLTIGESAIYKNYKIKVPIK